MLRNDEWKNDIMPEILDGHNVADFIDPDILEKLDELEREEERLTAEGYYDSATDLTDSEEERVKAAVKEIKKERTLKTMERRRQLVKNRPAIPQSKLKKRRAALEYNSDSSNVSDVDVDMNSGSGVGMKRPRSISVKRSASKSKGVDAMDVDDEHAMPSAKRLRLPTRDRSTMGLKDVKAKTATEKLLKNAQRMNNRMARIGESDRAIQVKKPKHLFTGKRSIGKTDRR